MTTLPPDCWYNGDGDLVSIFDLKHPVSRHANQTEVEQAVDTSSTLEDHMISAPLGRWKPNYDRSAGKTGLKDQKRKSIP